MSITKSDVIKHIRGSWSYISKKGYSPKARPGVYGKNLDDSIDRLAAKLNAPARVVRTHVIQLICEGVVRFVKGRLIVAKDKVEIDRKVASLSRLTLIISKPDDLLEVRFSDQPTWRLKAYEQEFRAELTVA